MTDAAPSAVLAVELSADPVKLVQGMEAGKLASNSFMEVLKKTSVSAQATFNGIDFSTVTSKAKAEQLKLIELQHQLDVARAAGATSTVKALESEIALRAKINQLVRAGLSRDVAPQAAKASLSAVEHAREEAEAAEAAAKRRERITGNPGQALQSVFSRTRVGVLEEGGARIPIFGSALEELGVAGLGAAAGLTVAAEAAEKVRKAMEYADDIDRTAKTLGVSTTELQKYDDAAIATSIGQDKFREALGRFNETFGLYQSGLAKGRAAKAFDALGFTPGSARQIGSVSEALDKAMSRLAALQNPQQRAALAERYGLTDLLPLLAEGEEGLKKFKEAQESYASSGALISPDDIKRAAELNDHVEELEHRVGQEFKAAFVEAAPAVEQIAIFIERCSRAAADLISKIPAVLRGLQELGGSLGKDADPGKQDILDHLDTSLQDFIRSPAGHFLDLDNHIERGFGRGVVERGASANLKDRLKDGIGQSLASGKADFSNERPPPRTPGLNLAGATKPKKGPADQTDDLDNEAKQDADTAKQALSTAQAALVRGIEAHAKAESDAVDDATTKQLDKLAHDEVKILAAKVDAHTADQLRLVEQAKADTEAAAVAKKEKIARDAREALQEQAYQAAQAIAAADLDVLRASQGLARTREAQARVAAQILAAEQDQARDRLDHDRDQQLKAAENDPARQEQIRANFAQQADLQDQKDALQRRALQDQFLSPGQKRVQELHTQGASLSDQVEGISVRGLDAVADGFAAIATGAQSAQEVVKNVVTSMISDFARLILQQEIELPLAQALFGTGAIGPGSTSYGPGGITVTGGRVDGGLFGSLSKLFAGGAKSSAAVPGAQDFGSLDDLIAAMPTLPAFSTGGTVSGPGGPTDDDVLARLSPGEQVLSNADLQAMRSIPTPRAGSGAANLTINVDAGGAFSLDHVASIVESNGRRVLAAAGMQLASVQRNQSLAAKNDLSRY